MLPLTRSRNRARFFGIPFSPSALFEGGTVPGAWYDPSDLSTMFNDAAGTTPVAMPGQGAAVPVGLMLDKSQGLVLGSELVTNGTFDTNIIGWTVLSTATQTWTSNGIEVSRGGASFVSQSAGQISLVAGKTYVVTCDVTVAPTAGNGSIGVFGADRLTERTLPGSAARNTVGELRTVFTATTTETGFVVAGISGSTTGTVTFDNISVRELPGNHATASGSARPVLSKRYNLLLATTTLATQNVTTVATSYTLRFTGTGSITLSGTATGTLNAGTHTVTATAGTLTLTVTGTVTDADLRRTIDANAFQPAYQRVVTATDYDGDGFLPYLEYSGAQAMATGTITPGAIDKAQVFAGVTKLSDAASGIIAEFSANSSTNNGAFLISSAGIAGFEGDAFYRVQGTNDSSGVYPASGAAPSTYVQTLVGDIAGATFAAAVVGRYNGATVTLTQVGLNVPGSGNFGNYPLYIGARAANVALSPFNGRMYSNIVRFGATLSAAQISATESWVAQRTGVSL